MSVNEKQTFVLALNGGMVGKYFPTQLEDDVLEPLKRVLKRELNEIFEKTAAAASAPPPAVAPAAANLSAAAGGGGGL